MPIHLSFRSLLPVALVALSLVLAFLIVSTPESKAQCGGIEISCHNTHTPGVTHDTNGCLSGIGEVVQTEGDCGGGSSGGGGGDGGGGGGGTSIATLTANPTTIAQGASSNLSASSEGVSGCSINNGVGAITANVTNVISVSPSQTTTYVLTCDSIYGGQVSASATVTVTPPTLPDLSGQVGGARTVTANQALTLYGTATNAGSTAVGSFPNLIQVCDANCATISQTLAATTLSGLAPGGYDTVSASYTPTTASQQYYRMCANYNTGWGNGVTESSYANNCSGWQTLSVSAQPVPPTATLALLPSAIFSGDSTTVSWGSTNATSCTGTNFSTGGATSGSASVSATTNTTYTVTCTGVAGTASDSKTLTVYPPLQPDLVAGAPSVGSAVAGQSTSLSAVASNIGTGSSGSFPILFHVNESGALVNSSYLAGLAPAGSGTGSASYTFPSVGTYQVRACANFNTGWTAITSESNYANNCGPWTTVTVSAAPNPQLSCNVSSTSITPGQSVTYSANPSGGASGPYVWTASDGGSHGSASTVTRTLTTPGIYSMNVDTSNAAVSYCPNVSVAATWCTNSSTDLSITATPNRVRAGQSVALTWSADGVNGEGATCSVSGPGVSWSSAVAAAPVCTASGSATPTISTQSTYTLTCGSVSESVTVNVIPNFQEF